jgi:hypothetical protein
VTTSAGTTAKGRTLIKKIQVKIKHILTPQASVATPQAQQKVRENEQRVRAEEQRVIDESPIITLPRITNVPPIMHAKNPTYKRALTSTPRIHTRVTQNNTLGKLPAINRVHPIPKKEHHARSQTFATPQVNAQELQYRQPQDMHYQQEPGIKLSRSKQ